MVLNDTCIDIGRSGFNDNYVVFVVNAVNVHNKSKASGCLRVEGEEVVACIVVSRKTFGHVIVYVLAGEGNRVNPEVSSIGSNDHEYEVISLASFDCKSTVLNDIALRIHKVEVLHKNVIGIEGVLSVDFAILRSHDTVRSEDIGFVNGSVLCGLIAVSRNNLFNVFAKIFC